MIFNKFNDKDNIKYVYENNRPIVKEDDNTICFGYYQKDIFELCYDSPFPGSSTYPANHVIWTGYSGKCLSPLEAWSKIDILKKAIRNWFYIICLNDFMITYNPDNRPPEKIRDLYVRYNENWGKALKQWDELEICRYVLNRFTVAKLAPRVTALSPNLVYKFMTESGLDFKNGVYCPMAGFGGIIEGSKKWLKDHNINADVEAYDINEKFCNYFSWSVRDVTAQHIETNKVVIVCPPYGPNDERWLNTPDKNKAGLDTYMGFHNWCKIITEYVKAPNYIFIGPTKENKNKSTGLFAKTSGVAWYPEYINGCFEIDENIIH